MQVMLKVPVDMELTGGTCTRAAQAAVMTLYEASMKRSGSTGISFPLQ